MFVVCPGHVIARIEKLIIVYGIHRQYIKWWLRFTVGIIDGLPVDLAILRVIRVLEQLGILDAVCGPVAAAFPDGEV